MGGQVRFAKYVQGGTHTQRHGRVTVTYGSNEDPGVLYSVASSNQPISSILPGDHSFNSWDATSFPSGQLTQKDDPPFSITQHHENQTGSAMRVQVTLFACGGIAIGVALCHALADAHSLTKFVHDWSSIHRAMTSNKPFPNLVLPVFNSSLIDSISGDIDGPVVDPKLAAISQSLPQFKFDWWASAAGSPQGWGKDTIPPGYDTENMIFGNPMPWSSWDLQAPVANHMLIFSAKEIEGIYHAAKSAEAKISRLDALLAHIWTVLTRARNLSDGETSLCLTLGLRSRLQPPLPASFIGSPIINARATAPVFDGTLKSRARSIRDTTDAYTSTACAAHLHTLAHESFSGRYWAAFMGSRHTIVTAWLHLDMYGVDFGFGSGPVWVDAVMSRIDGCIQVLECQKSSGGKWYEDGVRLSMYIRKDIVEKMLTDPTLRLYT